MYLCDNTSCLLFFHITKQIHLIEDVSFTAAVTNNVPLSIIQSSRRDRFEAWRLLAEDDEPDVLEKAAEMTPQAAVVPKAGSQVN